jgi:hypothetical protein
MFVMQQTLFKFFNSSVNFKCIKLFIKILYIIVNILSNIKILSFYSILVIYYFNNRTKKKVENFYYIKHFKFYIHCILTFNINIKKM